MAYSARHRYCSFDLGRHKIKLYKIRTLQGSGVGWGDHWGEHVQRGLVLGCKCDDIDDDTITVNEPSIPTVVIVDPSDPTGTGTTGTGTVVPEPSVLKSVLVKDLN